MRGPGADGYHDIETVFAFCEDGDELSAEPAEALSLAIDGPFGGGLDADENLVMQAARALQEASGTAAGADLRLTKLLPVAAGIGGGSADAAAALRLLNHMWGCKLETAKLEAIAAELGADVPACLASVPMRGTARGDQLEPVELGLSGQPVLLVNPRVELSTAEVFAAWDGVRPRARSTTGGTGATTSRRRRWRWCRSCTASWPGCRRRTGSSWSACRAAAPTCFAFFDSEQQRDRAEEGVPREWWRLATRLR